MEISQFIWNEDIIEHIIRHNVTPEEVEEVCFGRSFFFKRKKATKGINPTYYALGQTDTGRYLFVVFIYFKRGRAMVITARDMDQSERKYYIRRVPR